MIASEIVRIRNIIGDEYQAMANSFDVGEIAECAQRIEMLSQELIEACAEGVA